MDSPIKMIHQAGSRKKQKQGEQETSNESARSIEKHWADYQRSIAGGV
jgi:hypothetical protein